MKTLKEIQKMNEMGQEVPFVELNYDYSELMTEIMELTSEIDEKIGDNWNIEESNVKTELKELEKMVRKLCKKYPHYDVVDGSYVFQKLVDYEMYELSDKVFENGICPGSLFLIYRLFLKFNQDSKLEYLYSKGLPKFTYDTAIKLVGNTTVIKNGKLYDYVDSLNCEFGDIIDDSVKPISNLIVEEN